MNVAAQTGRDWVDAAMREHEGALLRYAARITGDADLARDVAQDVFLRLCGENPATLNGRLRPWLYTVCRNRAIELRRKRKRWFARTHKRTTMIQTTEPTGASQQYARLDLSLCPAIATPGTFVAPAGVVASAAESAEMREAADGVLRELARLPANQQEAIRLRFEHGLSYKEIAAVMNTTVSNVGVMIHTAIKKLRKKLVSDE